MSDPSHRAAAYWSGWALRSCQAFHRALEALAAQDPAVAEVTMEAITASNSVFVMRPSATICAYPAKTEFLVDICYRSAFAFQSAISLIHGVAPHFLAGLERDLGPEQGAGPLARAADRFFRRAITRVRQQHRG